MVVPNPPEQQRLCQLRLKIPRIGLPRRLDTPRSAGHACRLSSEARLVSGDAELLIERRGLLAVLTLNRPQALNTLTLAMLRGITAALVEFAGDPAIGAVLIRAEDRIFSSGRDVLGLLSHVPRAEFERYRRDYFATDTRSIT
jgi:hypothetical protein